MDGDYTIEDVMAHYGLTAAEAHAAMACYYDNQAELDATRERVLAEIRENAMTLEKFKASLADRNSEEYLKTKQLRPLFPTHIHTSIG